MRQTTNYNLTMERMMEGLPVGTPLLLHACCGPCLSAAMERLGGHFALTVYYYNPNIAPRTEYDRRLEAVCTLLERMPLEYPAKLLVGAYDEGAFGQVARGREMEPEGGERCNACFGLRMDAAARMAAEQGIEWVGTTLTVGPRKNAAQINRAGTLAAQAHGVRFLPADLKKKDGYRRSVALSHQYGLYRQDYCGCIFSALSR